MTSALSGDLLLQRIPLDHPAEGAGDDGEDPQIPFPFRDLALRRIPLYLPAESSGDDGQDF